MDSGYWWDPQIDFKECSGGLSISEWCSIPRDICCAVCPMPPISGPATTLVWSLGSCLNLILALILTQEAPYNMILQVIGTDGVLIASMVRASLKGGGLSQWHFYYVPLYMVSCIPHVLAASLSSVAAMSGVGAGDHVKFKTVAGSYTRQTPDAVLAGRVAQKKHGARKGYHLKEVVPRAKDKLPDSSTDREVYAHYTELNEQQTRDLPRFKLALIVKWTFLVHLLLWCGVFAYLYLGNYAVTQPNCIEAFDFAWYKVAMGSASASFVLFGFLYWIPMTYSLRRKSRRSVLMVIVSVAHSVRISNWVWQKHHTVRYAVAFFVFSIWVIIFIAFYIDALRHFLLLGDDPWDFGQINWAWGSLSIIAILGRSVFDLKDATYNKHFALHLDAADSQHNDSNPIKPAKKKKKRSSRRTFGWSILSRLRRGRGPPSEEISSDDGASMHSAQTHFPSDRAARARAALAATAATAGTAGSARAHPVVPTRASSAPVRSNRVPHT